MRQLILILFVLNSIHAQKVYDYSYSGGLGEIVTDSISVLPGALYQIDFCAAYIPDQVTVYMDYDSIQLWTGDMIVTDSLLRNYHGYSEFAWDGYNFYTVCTDKPLAPGNFGCIDNSGGKLRIKVTIPNFHCILKFKIRGNLMYPTVYAMTITMMFRGQSQVKDTIYLPVCESKLEYFTSKDHCSMTLVQPVDSSIKTETIVNHPTCSGESNGSIEFDKYPKFNLYHLPEGQYKIKIDNGICQRDFVIDLKSSSLCRWYIPNAFTPNGDGINDEFIMFTPTDSEYRLTIFDRWGNIVHSSKSLTNHSGWDGIDHLPGVYVWKIDCMDKHLFGNVTLIH